MISRIRTTLLAIAAALLLPAAVAAADSASQSLVERLRNGELVIFLRNGRAVLGATDEPLAGLPQRLREECVERQRVLTDEATADMRQIASQIEAFGIPIGEVLASPACRAVESAWYTFGKATIKPELAGLWDVELEGDRDAAEAELRRLLTSPPDGDGNLVIVSHVSNIRVLTDLDLNHGEAAIFEPGGGEGFNLVRRVMPDEWSRIATPAQD